jgi:hypothetical protein
VSPGRSRGVVAVVAAAPVISGCAAGQEQERLFGVADAARPQLDPRPPRDPLLAMLEQQTAGLDPTKNGNRWRDDDKLGNLMAQVCASASDARTGMAALNTFSRGWGKSRRSPWRRPSWASAVAARGRAVRPSSAWETAELLCSRGERCGAVLVHG